MPDTPEAVPTRPFRQARSRLSPGARLLLQACILLALSSGLIACESVRYYTQAIRGQLAIILGRQDIQRLLERPDLDAGLANKFHQVEAIRDFAARSLLLPVGNNYSTYVDLEREHVVWNVFAAPEFSVEPITWCFPIAGCVAYRGYFSERSAAAFADGLAAEGFDVYTGGVDAYSTLGWFQDSLLSSVIDRENSQLAGLIFHELAHQVVYVPGETTFNESFATLVEREGVRRWLIEVGQPELFAAVLTSQQRQQEFVELVSAYRTRLEDLYGTELSVAQIRLGKSDLQQALREEYQELKLSWQGYAGYDDWFNRSLNNAQLATVASYNDLLPFFQDLLDQEQGELGAFYDRVRHIADLTSAERAELIK